MELHGVPARAVEREYYYEVGGRFAVAPRKYDNCAVVMRYSMCCCLDRQKLRLPADTDCASDRRNSLCVASRRRAAYHVLQPGNILTCLLRRCFMRMNLGRGDSV